MSMQTMNSKLFVQLAAALLIACASALAQNPPTPPLSPSPQPFGGAVPAASMVDPATGLPVSQPMLIDPNWKDPDTVLKDVNYEGLPLSEVAQNLRHEFKDQFDIILPSGSTTVAMLPNGVSSAAGWNFDWQSEGINLHLKNVSASELFNAMNMLFENNRTPLRWELRVNGHRQVALLRVTAEPTPHEFLNPHPEEIQRIFFVGDLMGESKAAGLAAGLTMSQIVNTVKEVAGIAGESGGSIKFHEDAQLIIAKGTKDQMEVIAQTLSALRNKVEIARRKEKTVPPEGTLSKPH